MTTESNPTTTIIVPAYNEEEGIPTVLEKLLKVIDSTYEIIVVDDGSTDATSEVAARFPCRVIKHDINKGKGEGLKTGIRNSRGENVIWIDADDTYPVEVISKIVEALKNYDMVICSRTLGRDNIPAFNRMGIWLFRTLIRIVHGFSPYDPCTGLYGVKKHHLETMSLSSYGFAIEPEITVKGSRMKLKTLEIPIEYRPRVGATKLNRIKVGFENVWTIVKLSFWKPKKQTVI